MASWITVAAVAPATGGSLTKQFYSQVQVDISLDYGATWHSCVVSNVPVTVGITNLGPDGDDIVYGTELTQLDISGGTLPLGVVIRADTGRHSLGQTRIEEHVHFAELTQECRSLP